MPLASAMRSLVLVSALAIGACAQAAAVREDSSRMPAEVRRGEVSMAVGRVEPEVDQAEVVAAIQQLAASSPVCFAWPSVWLAARDRRSVFVVRYDLMRRDWGEETVAASEARMREFVEMGLLTSTGSATAGVVEYRLTERGEGALQGSPHNDARSRFCLGSERRVVSITSLEWGAYECGSLRVHFIHTAEEWPSWAVYPGIQRRLATQWGELGAHARGEVTLGRQWYPPGREPEGTANGALRSVCVDRARGVVTGGDLNLEPPPPPQ